MNWKLAERAAHTICHRMLNFPENASAADVKDGWKRYHRLSRCVWKIRGYTTQDQSAIMGNARQAYIPKACQGKVWRAAAHHRTPPGDMLGRLPRLQDYCRNVWRADLPATIYGPRFQTICPNLP